jgi:hypothetical protein
MEINKLTELNRLFEKALSNQANMDETLNLNNLYREFINDGRDINTYKNKNTVNSDLNTQRLRFQKNIHLNVS